MDLIKISVLGDIMCEPRLLKVSRLVRNQYDFSGVFQNMKLLLDESDYVVGNLETPLAGEEAGYVHSLFSFNAPDAFAQAAKNGGVDLLLTANNHCLDRGVSGLKRTVSVLDAHAIPHAGTFGDAEDRGNTYIRIGERTFAFISYTYGTNFSANHLLLSDKDSGLVNLLRPQNESYFIQKAVKQSLPKRAFSRFLRLFPSERRYYIRKFLGMTVNSAHADDNLIPETMQPYLDQLLADIEHAKKNADFVFFCPHIGGQFNEVPGAVSRYVFDFACKSGVDAIIASHAHVVQEVEMNGSIPCFYSLGNFSMSPNSVYLLHENLPDYGIAAHFYIRENGIEKTTFSILHIVEKDILTVYPVDTYFAQCSENEKDQVCRSVCRIYRTVTGRELQGDLIRREYEL